MLGFNYTLKWLRYSPPTAPPEPLPSGVERIFLQTPSGPLEVLYAAPKGSPPKGTSPFFFNHGGMGSAWVWLEYMQYLSARGVPCYAVSTRGHGNSWHPSYLRMVWGTPKGRLADDIVAGVKFAQEREGAEVVMVGHSSGGGLSQLILSERKIRVKALCLLCAVPGSGALSVYIEWWLLDLWFLPRFLLHGGHPNSPLSHPALLKRIFFSDNFPESSLLNFMRHVNAYESFLWPMTMMHRFADPRAIVQQISGWGSSSSSGERLLVMAGAGDRLTTSPIMKRLAELYRTAVGGLVAEKKLEVKIEPVLALEGEGGQDSVGKGVRYCEVPGAGHHLQNDVTWEIGARKLLEFYEQL